MSTNATVRRILAIAVVILLPVAIGTIYVGAIAGRAASPENIPAAVVNEDEMVTMKVGDTETPMLGGRLVAAQLTAPPKGSQVQLDWALTDEAAAKKGLEDGTYYAVVTIPKDFSAKLVSALQNSENPEHATVDVQANTKASTLAGKYGEQDARYAASAVSQTITQNYLTQVFTGLSTMGEQTKTAQEGATKLADGSSQLASGLGQTTKGTTKLSDGVSQLAAGAEQFQSGTAKLSSGAGQLSSASRQLASGVKQYTDGVSTAASGVKKMSSQAGQLVTGTKQLNQGAQGIKQMVGRLSSETKTAASNSEAGAKSFGTIAAGVGSAVGQLENLGIGLGTGLGALTTDAVKECVTTPSGPGCADTLAAAVGVATPQLASAQKAFGTVSSGVSSAAPLLKDTGTRLTNSAVSAGTANAIVNGPTSKQLPVTLKQLSSQLASGTSQLAKQTPKLVDGVKQLNSGMQLLAKNGPTLASGSSALATGIGQFGSGVSLLNANTGQLVSGIKGLNTGASQLATGMGQLQTGADGLASGTKQFADGLASSTDQLPSYSKSAVSQIASVVTTPVQASVTTNDVRSDDGQGSAAIIPIALWLGALGIFLLLRAVPRGASYSSAGPLRLTIAGLLPGAGMVIAAAVLLVAVLPAAGMKMSNWFAAALLAVFGGLVFTILNQAARALWGRLGSLISLAFFALQFACMGIVIPIESSPAIMRALAPILPMSELSAGLAGPVLGTAVPGAGTQVAALAIWGVVGLAATAWVVRRTQARAVVALAPGAGLATNAV